jgi:hypothetical protein
MAAHPVWAAMCHNDLQYGNIMALAPASPAELGPRAPAQRADAAAGSGHGGGPTTQGLADGCTQRATAQAAAPAAAAATGGSRGRGGEEPEATAAEAAALRVASELDGGWLAERLASGLSAGVGGAETSGVSWASTGSEGAGGQRGRRLVLPPDGSPRVRGQSPDRKRGASPPPGQHWDGAAAPFGGAVPVPGSHPGGGSIGLSSPPLTASPGAAISPASSTLRGSLLQHPWALGGAGRCSQASTDYPSNVSTRGGTSNWLDARPGPAAADLGHALSGSLSPQTAAGGGPGEGPGTAAAASATGPAAAPAQDPIRLIDYEYAGSSPIGFDIANHW